VSNGRLAAESLSSANGSGHLRDSIPPELLNLRQWVAYKTLPADKPKKVPVNPHTGGHASHSDPKTWGTFDEAVARAERNNLPGVGFVFSQDGLFGVDLDGCRDPVTGEIEPWAQEIIILLDSYTEISCSGTGVHILGYGTLPPGGRRKGKVEMYDRDRFFVVTGQHVSGELEHRREEVAELHARVFGTPAPDLQTPNDQELIERARRARNGDGFSKLLAGDTSGYPSDSEADLALCNHLAFWSGGDAQQMDRVFRQSGLYRPKWDERHYADGRTYGQGTIQRALDSVNQSYSSSMTPSPAVGWVKYLADAIVRSDYFAVDAGGWLYRYVNGVYRPEGRDYIRRRCKQILEETGATQSWSTSRANQVVEYIRVDAPGLWDRPPLDVLNVENGLLDVTTRELHAHTPDFLSAVQLPVTYNPTADCPAWRTFTETTLLEDCQHLPWQLIAWLMTPDTSIQKAALFLGDGGNGKSVLMGGIQTFLGSENVAGVSLHKLEADRFATARLVGKLANICPDLPSDHLAGTSIFKAITGGDPLHAEYKYGTSFEFVPFVRLVFSANHPPRSSDSSKAFFRRWMVVPFTRTFSGENEIPRRVLDARLADPRELSGVLNMALDALPTVREQGITESDSMQAAWNEFRQVTDPVLVWLDRNTVKGADAFVTKGDLLRAYNEDATAHKRPPMLDSQFGAVVKQWYPQVREGQKRIGDERPKVWYGIGLISTG